MIQIIIGGQVILTSELNFKIMIFTKMRSYLFSTSTIKDTERRWLPYEMVSKPCFSQIGLRVTKSLDVFKPLHQRPWHLIEVGMSDL